MFRHALMRALFMAACLVLAAAAQTRTQAQVILTEDFESGRKPFIWPGGAAANFHLDDTQAKVGRASGKAIIDAPNVPLAVYQYVKVKPGHRYALRQWVKAQEMDFQPGGAINVIVKFRNKEGDLRVEVVPLPVKEAVDWTLWDHTFVSPSGSETAQVIFLSYRRATGTVWVDGLEMEDLGPATPQEVAQVTPPPPPVVDPADYTLSLRNGDFESGEQSWSPWFKPEQADWSIDAQEALSGQGAVRLDVKQPGRHFLAQRVSGFAPGHTYRLSVAVRTQDHQPAGAAVIVDFSPTAARPRPYLDLAFLKGTKPWQTHSMTFKAPYDVQHAHVCLVATAGTIWFDDLTIERVAEPQGNLVQPIAVNPRRRHEPGQGPVTTLPPLITELPGLPDDRAGYFFDAASEQMGYVSSQAASLLRFQPVNRQHNANLMIALPESIELQGGFRSLKIVDKGTLDIDGQPHRLHEVQVTPSSTKFTFLWQAKPGTPDGRLKGYYWAAWSDQTQPRQTLDIEVVTIPQVTPFAHLPVWLCYPSDLMAQWGDMAPLRRAGINMIDVWAYMRPTSGETAAWGRAALLASQAKADAAGLDFSAWMREWWWHDGAKDDQGAALDIDGKKTDMLCLSYRGRYFEEILTQGRQMIDLGVLRHSTDPEMYRDGHTICFCDRCAKEFATYLAEHHPGLAYQLPAQFMRDAGLDDPLALAWGAFKVHQAAEFFAQYTRQMRAHLQAKGQDPAAFSLYTMSTYHRWWEGYFGHGDVAQSPPYRLTLESPAQWGRFVRFMAPMSYTEVYANMGDYDMLTTYKDALSIRKLLEGTDAFVAPILSTGYPYTRGFNSDMDAEYLKYAILELFAGGARGFGVWGECPLDARDLQAIAQVVGQLQPYERLLLAGRPTDTARARHGRVMAKTVQADDGALVFVSEYSADTLGDTIDYPVTRPMAVIRLHDGRQMATLRPGGPTGFDITLDTQRAMIYAIVSAD